MSLEGVDTSWLIPWANRFLGHVEPGENPWTLVIPILEGVFYPSVNKAFRPQMWVLFGVFIVSALILLAGLLLRLAHGKLWLVHRIDGFILIPNLSVCFSLCALAYAAVGMVSIVDAIRISEGYDYPSRYIGLQGMWPLLLYLGIYSELWATYSAYYIRRFGTQGNRRQAFVAAIAPWLPIIIAIVPPAAFFSLASKDFNKSFKQFLDTRETMRAHEKTWTIADGLDLAQLALLVQPAAQLSEYLIASSHWTRIGFGYSAGILLLTLASYIAGAWLEIRFLKRQAAALRIKPVMPVMRDRRRSEQMEEEWLAGVVRQARLLKWAARNRAWTAGLIGAMLLESSTLALCYALTPRTLVSNAAQFQTIILTACYMNGVLSTLVSLLILFRSFDGSSAIVRRLQALFPWLPLPPAVSLRGNEATLVQKPAPVDREKGKEASLSVRFEGTAEPLPVMVELGKEELVLGDGKREEEDDEKDWPRRGSGTSTLV
ncbi:hypothetical protein BCR35DRAFT_325899 [Leucosporidium creatinivorum]|uniref:Proteophosphoglycan ppg4 n=1 Tax=Leucosporidium creatinivorum TaxID=106004 RepID=A0A1Y2EW52_9BASI|nr:hypothetical protein BCR35DRAFT_325899 [Leucosporidium creatinivorum]